MAKVAKRTKSQKKKKTGKKHWGLGTWFGLGGLVVGFISVGFAIYFYNVSVSKRELMFVFDPARTVLIESDALKDSAIRITMTDGTPVGGDITSLRYYFWNNGRESIKREHVLEPISIFFEDPDVHILDVKVLRISRPNIVQPVLTRNKDLPDRSLDLDFAILEQNDGAAAQIIFSGPPEAALFVSGIVEGALQLAKNETVARGRFWREYAANFGALVGAVLGMGGLFAVAVLFEQAGIGGRLRSIRKNNIRRANAGQKIRYYGLTIALKIPAALGLLLLSMFALFVIFGPDCRARPKGGKASRGKCGAIRTHRVAPKGSLAQCRNLVGSHVP